MVNALGQYLTSLTDYRVVAVQLSVVVMLISGMVLRRSLGAWPCWLAAFVFAVLVELLWRWQGLARNAGVATMVEMMVLPTVFLLLARRQIIPGLRRGEWSEEERTRWLTHQALSASPQHRSTIRLRFR